MKNNDFLIGIGDIDERFIDEANSTDRNEKTARRHTYWRRTALLISAIVLIVVMSVTAAAAIIPLIVPKIPVDAVESLNIRSTNTEEREAEGKRIIREQLEASRALYGEENIIVSDEEVEEIYQNSMQRFVSKVSGGVIKICNYDMADPSDPSGEKVEGTGYFYEGYLPVIYIEITDSDGLPAQTFSYDPTLAKHGAFAKFTQNADGKYELEFIEVGDALKTILAVASETLTPGVNVKKADGTFDYSAFYAALASNLHREYFAILYERAGIAF